MTPAHRYSSEAALRSAIEEHLRRHARATGVPLDRLRKEVAHQRLLARLDMVAPEGSWALKGGQALLARLGGEARATRDADATWRAELDGLGEALEDAMTADLGDGFRFEVAAPRPMTGETPEGGLRYPVLALLDGRDFERIQLDVNVVPDDPRPLDRLVLRDLLHFAGIAPPSIPVIPVAQHLAEKLHAYVRDYGQQTNSRPRDLFDMLVIARSLPIPAASTLRTACLQTFDLRSTSWPPALPQPPASWIAAWDSYARDHRLPWTSLDAAGVALASFWRPVLTDGTESQGTGQDAWWDPERWAWSATARRSTTP